MTRISPWLRHLAVAVTLVAAVGCASSSSRDVGEYASDSSITARVKTALAQEDIGSLLNVEVETYEGTVQLSGFVDDEETRDRAGEIAEEVDGVYDVENSLIVK